MILVTLEIVKQITNKGRKKMNLHKVLTPLFSMVSIIAVILCINSAVFTQQKVVPEFKDIYSSLDNFSFLGFAGTGGQGFLKLVRTNDNNFVTFDGENVVEIVADYSRKTLWKSFYYCNGLAIAKNDNIIVIRHKQLARYKDDNNNMGLEGLFVSFKWFVETGSNYFQDVIVDNDDNNSVVVGYSDYDSFGVPKQGGIIAKYDINNNVIWKKDFRSIDSHTLNDITQDSDGCYVAIGSIKKTVGDIATTNGFIVKYDKNGKLLWNKEFKETDQDTFSSVKPVPGGGVIVVGNSNDIKYVNGKLIGDSDGLLVKYDVEGNVVLKIRYDKNGFGEVFNDVEIAHIDNKNDVFIAVGKSWDSSKELRTTDKALMVVFSGDTVLYESQHFYSTGQYIFNSISLLDGDWRNCIIVGAYFNYPKGVQPYALSDNDYYNLTMVYFDYNTESQTK